MANLNVAVCENAKHILWLPYFLYVTAGAAKKSATLPRDFKAEDFKAEIEKMEETEKSSSRSSKSKLLSSKSNLVGKLKRWKTEST